MERANPSHVLLAPIGNVLLCMDTAGGGWAHADLSAATGAPEAAAGSTLTSYAEPSWRHVCYLGGDGHVHELYMGTAGGGWAHADLSAATGAPEAAAGGTLTSYWE